MNNGKRGLFIDFDGTLADSVSLMRGAYFDFLKSFGKAGSDAEFAALMGPSLREIAVRLKKTYALEPGIDDLIARYHALIDDFYVQAPPMAGAANFLERATRAGWPVAVVTTAAEPDVRRWLAHTGLDTFVADVVGAESVAATKPDPEPYRTALGRSGCDPARSVAVEDSPQGAAAAVGAGLHTYVLGEEPGGETNWPRVAGFVPSYVRLAEILFDV